MSLGSAVAQILFPFDQGAKGAVPSPKIYIRGECHGKGELRWIRY
jgi:hypothetical protein